MSFSDAHDLVSSLFIMLNKKIFILFRIEFLVVLVTLLFFVMFLMDFYRHIIHSTLMRSVFSVFDAVSDSIVLYLLGAMQAAPFKNQLFPVWALVLVNFRYSADYISGYGVPDSGGRRFIEWRNVLKLLGSAFLNWSRGSRFARPLWLLWALQMLRSWYRFYSHNLASKSVWHGGSSELVSEYMSANYKPSNPDSEDCDPGTMKGYNYLVCGESKQGMKLRKPQYALHIDYANQPRKTQQTRRRYAPRENPTNSPRFAQERSPLITLDKIWRCLSRLLNNPKGNDGKVLSLAFALSRLLRCRFEDVTLQEYIFCINRQLVKKIINENDGTDDAFSIMELQLALTNDYFNTRYPMVFWCGLLSFFMSLLPSVVTFGVVCWLGVDIRKIYKPPNGELANLVKGFNVDMIITWVFIVLMMIKEIWEIATYLFSDWMRLLLVCKYVQRRDKSINGCMDHIIIQFFRSKVNKKWHGLIDQYAFVQSYDDRPRCWNHLHNLTTGLVPKKEDGAKLSSAIKVPDFVKQAVRNKLHIILMEAQGHSLPEVIKTLADVNSDRMEQLQQYLPYFQLPTSSHIILVWHIATSLCEMELAEKHNVDLHKPGFLCSLLSCFTGCCSPQPYLMDVDEKNKKNMFSWFTNCCPSQLNGNKKVSGKLPDKLQETYITANSLSRYCAYLLVSKPDMIPDSFLVPKIVFQKAVKTARDGILKYCDSLHSRHIKLKDEADKPIKYSDNEDVLKQGAILGKKLLDQEHEEGRWEILAGVWAELLIHIAPTWNAEAHKKCLSGGEFITHIWSLLWHCGIHKSSLWPTEDATQSNASAAHQDNNVKSDNEQAVEMRRACADMRNNQIGIKVHEAAETKGSKDPKTEGTGSSEIEETSQVRTMETTKYSLIQRGIAGQAKNEGVC